MIENAVRSGGSNRPGVVRRIIRAGFYASTHRPHGGHRATPLRASVSCGQRLRVSTSRRRTMFNTETKTPTPSYQRAYGHAVCDRCGHVMDEADHKSGYQNLTML